MSPRGKVPSVPGVPVKLEAPVYEAVRFYSRLYGETQSQFAGRCVLFFAEHHTDEIQAKKDEFIARIDNLPNDLREYMGSRLVDDTE